MKKQLMATLLVAGIWGAATAQSIIKTAESKSGILVGGQNARDFAGITYERGSDDMTFNYKENTQTGKGNPLTNADYRGWNFDLGVDLSKNTSTLVKKDKWQGGVQGSVTFLKMWDITITGNAAAPPKYKSMTGTVMYETKAECEAKEGTTCIEVSVADVSNPDPVKQFTFFATIGEEINRINYLNDQVIKSDSVFTSVNDKLQSKLTFTAGLNNLYQLHPKLFLSMAVSVNLNFINYSGSKYETVDLQTTDTSYFNSKDKKPLSAFGKSKEYIPALPENEFQVIPRFDIFLRYNLGENKPYIGVIGSYAPVISSFGAMASKNNYAVGPSLSLPGLSDQVVFALMSEWQEDLKGKLNYSLSFRASFPFVFN